ncbi:hypothetical protein PR048_020991 [Dryococelus australis]|uniref:Uncharacterized protein n=1 Tax=Dryococelus australis TaxID=614101 RepID=A0ABQ9GX28_9NEOP|nr:hypothetical protein PR048_020991 [Dryococelus australis]
MSVGLLLLLTNYTMTASPGAPIFMIHSGIYFQGLPSGIAYEETIPLAYNTPLHQPASSSNIDVWYHHVYKLATCYTAALSDGLHHSTEAWLNRSKAQLSDLTDPLHRYYPYSRRGRLDARKRGPRRIEHEVRGDVYKLRVLEVLGAILPAATEGAAHETSRQGDRSPRSAIDARREPVIQRAVLLRRDLGRQVRRKAPGELVTMLDSGLIALSYWSHICYIGSCHITWQYAAIFIVSTPPFSDHHICSQYAAILDLHLGDQYILLRSAKCDVINRHRAGKGQDRIKLEGKVITAKRHRLATESSADHTLVGPDGSAVAMSEGAGTRNEVVYDAYDETTVARSRRGPHEVQTRAKSQGHSQQGEQHNVCHAYRGEKAVCDTMNGKKKSPNRTTTANRQYSLTMSLCPSRGLVVRLANRGRSRSFTCGNRAVVCHWSVGFIGDLSFPPPLHSRAAQYLPHVTLISSLIQSNPWISETLKIEVLRADEGEARRVWSNAGMQRWGKREISEKTRRTAASSGTFTTRENPGTTPPGIESGSPSWEAILSVEVNVEVEPNVELDVEANLEVEVDAEANVEVEVDVDANVEVYVDVEVELDVEANSEANVEAEVDVDTNMEVEMDVKANVEVEMNLQENVEL